MALGSGQRSAIGIQQRTAALAECQPGLLIAAVLTACPPPPRRRRRRRPSLPPASAPRRREAARTTPSAGRGSRPCDGKRGSAPARPPRCAPAPPPPPP